MKRSMSENEMNFLATLLKDFDAGQIYAVLVGLEQNFGADLKFNRDQMEQIRKGLEQGLDVSIYANPKYDRNQMKQIRNGLEQGLDVSIYADPQYDWRQMREIRTDLEFGVDA